MQLNFVGDGKVSLLAGGGKIFTDIAARFVRSERSLDEIVGSEYDKNLVRNIIDSGHKAALEFDYFIFGIEGFARVTEVQLVRKRIASYLIKSGRFNKNGKRSFDMVIPEDIKDLCVDIKVPVENIRFSDDTPLKLFVIEEEKFLICKINTINILEIIEEWYNKGVADGYKEENLRYIKPQATEFKALLGMNCHALHDWFQIRTCLKAQTEIRDLATKMLKLCKEATPDLFENSGPSCKVLGYCPENKLQHENCKDFVLTKNEALKILKSYKKG